MKPRFLVMSGYGFNCEEETAFAVEKTGGNASIVHITDLVDGHDSLARYQGIIFPGGFSYGDDTGSGNAFANKVRIELWDDLMRFVDDDKLVLGICNGFQVMVNLGLLPGLDDYGERQVALVHNDSARYTVRWVDLQFEGESPWTRDLTHMSLPVAHGEGKFYADDEILERITASGLVSARYFQSPLALEGLPVNPNGSLDDIAGITDETGRLMGMMPHPERAIDYTHLPQAPKLIEARRRNREDIPEEGPGLQIFRNGVEYFEG